MGEPFTREYTSDYILNMQKEFNVTTDKNNLLLQTLTTSKLEHPDETYDDKIIEYMSTQLDTLTKLEQYNQVLIKVLNTRDSEI